MNEPPSNPTSMSQDEAQKLLQRIHELLTEDPKMFVRRRVEELFNKELTSPLTQISTSNSSTTTTAPPSNHSLSKGKDKDKETTSP
jgi:hypothetical protein